MNRYVADSARIIYGQQEGGGANKLEPRLKYQFSVALSLRTDPTTADGSVMGIDMTRIANVTMPSITFKTETINQYNLKRTIQTGVDYGEVTIEAYDTRDGNIETFLKLYSNYYYNNVMKNTGESTAIYDAGVAGYGERPDFLNGTQAGYKLPVNKYCITQLIILRSHPDDYNFIELINPMITRIDSDALDYSDSQPVRYKITFSYESYRISTTGVGTNGGDRQTEEKAKTPPEPKPANAGEPTEMTSAEITAAISRHKSIIAREEGRDNPSNVVIQQRKRAISMLERNKNYQG